ncbi:MAG: glycosyltransferase family 2 protein [Arenicellales bacterium]
MNNQVLVSVVMPAYNHEKFIGETIDSVLNQSWRNLELIIIDDGSTDQTADIVKAYDDPRVHYFHQHNQDAYNALNNGMDKAKGDFISIINSDDVYAPNRLERLITLLQQNGGQAIFSDIQPIDDDSQPLNDPDFGWNQWHKNNRDFLSEMPGDLYRGFLHGNFMVTTSNLIMTATAQKQIGHFAPIRYLHDYEYIFRLLRAFPDGVNYLEKEKLMFYRIHSGNTISEAAITGREQDQAIIREAVLARCDSNTKEHVNTGIDRLIKLDQELAEVRRTLTPEPEQSSAQEKPLAAIPSKTLLTTLLKRLRSKF